MAHTHSNSYPEAGKAASHTTKHTPSTVTEKIAEKCPTGSIISPLCWQTLKRLAASFHPLLVYSISALVLNCSTTTKTPRKCCCSFSYHYNTSLGCDSDKVDANTLK